MGADRLLDILARLAEKGSTFPSSASLCEVATDVSAPAVPASCSTSATRTRGTLYSSDPVSAQIEELQFTLGEGPCIDAHTAGRPVLEPDLADPDHRPVGDVHPRRRWRAGARALFGFPLTVGAIRLGALNLYRGARALERRTARRFAGRGRGDRPHHPGDAGRAGTGGARAQGAPATQLESGANLRLVVHQASGMVSVQLGLSIAEALVRLRGYAFRHDLPIEEVAARVWSARGVDCDSRAAEPRGLVVTTPRRTNGYAGQGRSGQRMTERTDSMMDADTHCTLVELADTLVDDFDVVDLLTILADRCVEALDVAAAGLMLASAEGDLRVVASSSEAMRVVELFELQAGRRPLLGLLPHR